MFLQCMYPMYCVLFSPLWLKSEPGWPAISVSTSQQFRVGQIVWFGWLSAISQLARRVGEGGGVRQLCLHSISQPYTTWPRWREQGGITFPPLVGDSQFGRGDRHCGILGIYVPYMYFVPYY
jgi:hypothetical protein